jgi:glycosyltransferase involved in cell wall biosynthesis
MRLLFVVQRYGAEVLGGAEEACRNVATRMAARGHDVSVVTSCATSYMDWANTLPAGTQTVDGVTVHRLPVQRPRDMRIFDALQGRVVIPRTALPAAFLQREWMRQQGPWLPQLPEAVADLSSSADASVFFTYLYWTTCAGLPASRSPSVLHPAAHDELPIHLPLFDLVFRMADGLAFATEEEADMVRKRFRINTPSRVVGLGVDLDMRGDVDALRRQFGLSDLPYLVCVGRIEPGKGSAELVDFFAAYRRRHAQPLKLLMVGEEVHRLPRHPDVVMAGFVDDATRDAAILGATALVQPSYFESFSMSLVQAWAAGVPALVQSHSAVLRGHCRRSGGGIPYRGYAEFEVALERLLADQGLREHMGEAGREYVNARFAWPAVIDRYSELLEDVRERFPERRNIPPE